MRTNRIIQPLEAAVLTTIYPDMNLNLVIDFRPRFQWWMCYPFGKEMIPREVNGNPVRFFAWIDTPVFPRGYPGDGGLEPTTAFLISVQRKDDEDSEAFWLSCLGDSGRVMAGEMFYTLESAKRFPEAEFDTPELNWQEL